MFGYIYYIIQRRNPVDLLLISLSLSL